MSDRLRFGIFMAPFHRAGENPTLAIERDLQLIEHLDRIGWDEAWIGEHHSAGTEIIASPEIFIAAAAQRTRHIKLGTGVISVAYHNPYMIAERAVQLDHMTRGRFMLGCGPGSLPTDAIMLGLDPTETRPLLEEGMEVIMQLLTSDEPVTSQTKMWNLVDARLHLRQQTIVAMLPRNLGRQQAAECVGGPGVGDHQAHSISCPSAMRTPRTPPLRTRISSTRAYVNTSPPAARMRGRMVSAMRHAPPTG